VALAPGRSNLIGEHTDYNNGLVMPIAVNRHTAVVFRPGKDSKKIRVYSETLKQRDEFSINSIKKLSGADNHWANYVRGTVKHLLAHGADIRGADLALAGDVPQGAGLSSSASLEVAVLQAFKTLYRLDTLDPTTMAQVAQAAENRFVGCACGIMDQLISARGVDGHALLIDCRSLETTPVKLPEGLAVMIVHSRVKRGLVDSEYNLRRLQCEEASRHLGVDALRDATLGDFEARQGWPSDVVMRRARHVITENQRTLAAAMALQAGDVRRMGELMAQSHASMRDDFEITVPAIDQLVEIMQAEIGDAGGSRMTGGGFGGCVVGLLPESLVEVVREAVAAKYRSPNGERADVYVCHASSGAGPLE